MNFEFSDDAATMQGAARDYLQDRYPSAQVRRVVDGSEPYSRDLWNDIAAMGWVGTAVPEAYGGSALGDEVACLLALELGRALAAVPWTSSVSLAAELLLELGTEAQKQHWLPQLCDGSVIATVADPIALDAAELAGGARFSARLPAVVDGSIADLLIIPIANAGALSAGLVNLRQDGVTCTPLELLDPSRDAAAVSLDAVTWEALGDGADCTAAYERVMNRAAILVAFEQLGGADACLSSARDYALGRIAFGRPIGSFQAIKHKLADVYVGIEIARSHAYYGALALSDPSIDLTAAAAAARISASAAYDFAAKENIQVHGGVGFTWDYDCHLFYRRSRHLAQVLGAGRRWSNRLAARLLANGSTDGQPAGDQHGL